jgi:hypothetical protein
MGQVKLKKSINKQQITFYLKSCKYFRFPFFDTGNCYRRDGLFGQLEDTLNRVGAKMTQEYGDNFVSINLRGSWLRGIPIAGDDLDVLFIVKNIPLDNRIKIRDFTRKCLKEENELFDMCRGKVVMGMKVEPILFLDLAEIAIIMNKFMYGLGHVLKKHAGLDRDDFQDSFFGSIITEKKAKFLKSGILIPYVGWIYGSDRKQEVFSEISKYLPVPLKQTSIYSRAVIEEGKETIHQAIIARNLIYPSLEIKKLIDLSSAFIDDLKKEAMELYSSLELLEDVFARAVINYIYTLTAEEKILGEILTRDRIKKFASSYDNLVDGILKNTVIRQASGIPVNE